MKENKEFKKYFSIVLTLAVITAVIAGILAFVNSITEDKINDNTQLAVKNSISEIFGECEIEEIPDEYEEPVSAVYLVKNGDNKLGWCVYTKPKGYGGEVEMMVGIDLNGAVKGISVVSSSETPGIGSKVVTDTGYLSKYNGLSGSKLTLGTDIDAVSGATKSSKAVNAGVNSALALNLAGGESNG